jgi:hypothetical protein
MFWLPGLGIGGAMLTNGQNGYLIRNPFLRRLVEVLYDARPEAQAQLDALAKSALAEREKWHEKLDTAPNPGAVKALASRYTNPLLGAIDVRRNGGKVAFDVGGWASEVTTRREADGSLPFATTAAGSRHREFLVGKKVGTPTLTVIDEQLDYVFVAEP